MTKNRWQDHKEGPVFRPKFLNRPVAFSTSLTNIQKTTQSSVRQHDNTALVLKSKAFVRRTANSHSTHVHFSELGGFPDLTPHITDDLVDAVGRMRASKLLLTRCGFVTERAVVEFCFPTDYEPDPKEMRGMTMDLSFNYAKFGPQFFDQLVEVGTQMERSTNDTN